MTPNQMEQDFHFLRSQVQRLNRLIDALESSPLLVAAMTEPEPEPQLKNERDTDMPDPEICTIADLEREAILNAHEAFGSNTCGACAALDIGKTTYYRKLKEYGVRA